MSRRTEGQRRANGEDGKAGGRRGRGGGRTGGRTDARGARRREDRGTREEGRAGGRPRPDTGRQARPEPGATARGLSAYPRPHEALEAVAAEQVPAAAEVTGQGGDGGDAGGTAGVQPPHSLLEALLAFCVARSCFSATALGSSVFLGASSSPALPPQKGVPQGAFWPHFFLCLHANDQGISSKLMVLITVLAANNITINPTLMVSINRPSYLSSSPGISGCW